MATFELERTIPADHPSLPGHFPGSPIVPGVVILDEVGAAVALWRDGARVAAIATVKFLAPLKPDQAFTIQLAGRDAAGHEVDFSCRTGDEVIVQGRLLLRARAS